MKNKLKILSATILLFSAVFSVFTACSPDKDEISTTSESDMTTAIHATDYTYKVIATQSESKTEYIHTVPPLPTERNKKETLKETHKALSVKDETTKKASSGGEIDEKSNGLFIVTKTSPVTRGGTATVIVQGTPYAEYTIQFFKNATDKASYEGLKNICADSSGFVSWTFIIEDDCEPGNRKIMIKEKDGEKFIQTSITVQ